MSTLPCGHKKANHHSARVCQTCAQIAAGRRQRRSRRPAKRHLYPQYWRWLGEIKAEVGRVSRW